MRAIKGLGKKERDRQQHGNKREIRTAFKGVAGADLRGQVEFLSAKIEKQAGVVDAVGAILLLFV